MVILAIIIALLSPTHAPACATEDAAGPCYWDASARGNGHGTSFYVDGAQHTHYTSMGSTDHD